MTAENPFRRQSSHFNNSTTQRNKFSGPPDSLTGMDLLPIVDEVVTSRTALSPNIALLVGISGIDGCGKSYISELLARQLIGRGLKSAVLCADGWLNLPGIRFGSENPGLHFYNNALRLDEMFAKLVEPLRRARSIDLSANYTEETATQYRQHKYQFSNIDVLLLEGIFLFKHMHVDRFDLKIWVDCSFDTALKRAVMRKQEGLSRNETLLAYKEIYFPAQRLHFKFDKPKAAADLILHNDER